MFACDGQQYQLFILQEVQSTEATPTTLDTPTTEATPTTTETTPTDVTTPSDVAKTEDHKKRRRQGVVLNTQPAVSTSCRVVCTVSLST